MLEKLLKYIKDTPRRQMEFFDSSLFVVLVFGAVILAFSALIYYKEALGKELPDFSRPAKSCSK